MDSGMESFFLQRIRNRSLFRRILLTDLLFFLIPNDEGGLAYNDPDIGVEWPIPEGMELILSDKDQKWGSFKEYTANRSKKD